MVAHARAKIMRTAADEEMQHSKVLAPDDIRKRRHLFGTPRHILRKSHANSTFLFAFSPALNTNPKEYCRILVQNSQRKEVLLRDLVATLTESLHQMITVILYNSNTTTCDRPPIDEKKLVPYLW
jgi:hypothetical protein